MRHKKPFISLGNPLKIHEKGKKKIPTLKKFGQIAIKVLAAIVLVVIVLFAWYSKDLPTPGKIKNRNPVESSHIYDRNGKSLYEISGDVKRTVIDDKTIPDNIKKATVSVEDKDFYKHHGISITGILRAAYNNISKKTSYTSGGSTITQQYVKNALLSPQKTFTRKLQEVILTLEIESMYSKDQILGMYLNEIPYGSNAYGVQAASQTYFGKDAKDLTLAESATLASLPKAPTFYSPYGLHPDNLKSRKDYVLDRMASLKYITSEEASKAKEEKLNFVEQHENITAPHFVFYIKEKLVEEYGEQVVESGGLKVTTTLDLDKQKIAEGVIDDAYKNKISAYGATNASLVSIDPKTGQILSMVGSHDYYDKENDGQVNVAISDRQPGSSFKPLAYATAFMGKYSPGATLFDVTTNFGNYTPNNYDGTTHGAVTMRTALANSLNIPAVKTLYLAGIDKVLDQAHKMGITTLNDKNRYGLSLVLGGGEVKLADLTTAYGVFADKGVLHETTGILKVEGQNGKVLEEYKDNKGTKEALDPQVAYEISNILSDNNARKMVFGRMPWMFSEERPMAVKTGTTQEFRDAWTIGYTPSVVTGVWVGNNDNHKMNQHADGSMVAAPIWRAYMDKVLANTPVEQFDRPAEIKEGTIAKYTNKLPSSSTGDKITDIFAAWQMPTEYDDAVAKVNVCTLCDGNKLASDLCPAANTVERSYGNIHSEVPDKSNWENPVRAWLEAAGFGIGTPPTEKCELDGETPAISITNPKSGQTVSGNFSISVQTSSKSSITNVEYYLDGTPITSTNSSPYSTTYNAASASTGSHKLEAKITNEKGLSASNSITINISHDSTGPGNVTGVNLTPGSHQISAKWTNPSNSDLSQIRIYLSTSPGALGSLYIGDITAIPNAVASYNITGLNPGANYYVIIRPVNSSGVENSSMTQYSSKPTD